MYTVYICKCIMCIIRSRYAGKTRAEAVLLCPLRSIADPADPSNQIAVATPAHRDWELTRRPNLIIGPKAFVGKLTGPTHARPGFRNQRLLISPRVLQSFLQSLLQSLLQSFEKETCLHHCSSFY